MYTNEQLMEFFPFKETRHFQLDVVREIIDAYEKGFKYVVLDAPTSTGKSPLAIAIARYFQESYILTSQKTLQHQYIGDFYKTVGLRHIEGKDNYTCLKSPNNYTFSCKNGSCITSKNKTPCLNCPYKIARDEGYGSNHTVLNYAYFLSMNSFEKQTPRKLIVLDECHNVETEVLNQSTVSLHMEDIKYHQAVEFPQLPNKNDSYVSKMEWIKDLIIWLAEKVEILSSEIEETKEKSELSPLIKLKNFYDDILNKGILMTSVINDENECIISHPSNMQIIFKPLYGRQLIHNTLFKFGENKLLMSATVGNKKQFCKEIDVPEDQVYYIACDATIPEENRPVYNMNVASLSYEKKNDSMPIIMDYIKVILTKHKEDKGIIHCVSYEITKNIQDSIQQNRLVFPVGKTRIRDIKLFFENKNDNLVLVSPSLAEGISLDDDFARFSIIVKLPYLNLGDPWIKKRKEIDEEWYKYQTASKLVQMCGRTVRSPTDFAKTYILDNSFMWFVNNNKHLFPKWWIDGIEPRMKSGIVLIKGVTL